MGGKKGGWLEVMIILLILIVLTIVFRRQIAVFLAAILRKLVLCRIG